MRKVSRGGHDSGEVLIFIPLSCKSFRSGFPLILNVLRVRNIEAEMCGERSMFDVALALESCMICGVLSSCFTYGARFVLHALSGATWQRDLGPRCVPCESVPYSFVVRYEEFNLFMSILDQSLAQGGSQLEPFGLAGVVPLQGIAEALLDLQF